MKTRERLEDKALALARVGDGVLTRGQVARELGLSLDAATRLLRQLQQKGVLELRGERKKAHYVLTE